MNIIKHVFAVFILCASLFGQRTFFIKYKDSFSSGDLRNLVEQRVVLNSPDKTGSFFTHKTEFLAPFAVNDNERLSRIIKVTFDRQVSKDAFRQMVRYPELVEYIEENKTFKIDGAPNDSLFTRQWALAKINAVAAWEISRGADSVRIGIIDTGIDFLHPDLKNQIFINSGEIGNDNSGHDKRNNGLDDDGNGFIDDYMGWDFTDRTGFPYDSTGGDYLDWDNYPMDENVYSHGTAVAGIIGAQTGNLLGVAGVAPNVKLMNLRAFDPDGFGEEDDVAAAILYAVKMKAKVINMSFGDNSFSYVLRDVIQYAYSKNVVLVASAGNSGSSAPHYPSGYLEVISVGNSTQEDYVAGGSNYGSTLDLVAPGSGILTTQRNYSYSEFNGTSAAAPFVSAVAGLILSKENFNNEEIKQIIKSTSDDLGTPGWDERSGSGRLNAEKALRVLSPAIVKFEYPYQDFATSADTVEVFGTVLSPQFTSFSLYYGLGLNPANWKVLINNGQHQFSKQKLASINISAQTDTALTLRLVLSQNNGITVEERLNMHIMRKPPLGEAILFPAFYGRVPTVSAAVVSEQNTVVRMMYRRAGQSGFQSISLDGFALNNFFVKRTHYGFIPLSEVAANSDYDIYFELENLAGKKSVIKDANGNNFLIRTSPASLNASFEEMPYSLPQGLIFNRPLPITSQAGNEILYNKFNDVSITSIYSLGPNGFSLRDSLKQRIPKDAGDFNGDGKVDILSNWGRNLYISTQSLPNSPAFADAFKKEDGASWPVLVKDMNGDGKQEALVITSDTTFSVFQVQNDLSLTLKTKGRNFSKRGYGGNIFDYPHAQVADIDMDGRNELWIADADGDVLCYSILSADSLVPDTNKSFSTGFTSSSSYLQTGDFNGDGRPDLGIILQSIENLDVAKFNLVYIISNIGNRDTVIFAQAFIDPASEFSVFTRKTYNTLKFAKVLGTQKDALILALFPYAYVFSFNAGNPELAFFKDNANANAIFTGDLNGNGKLEFGIPCTDKIHFYEFQESGLPGIPALNSAASANDRQVRLAWISDENRFYIYRGNSSAIPVLLDSTNAREYIDTAVILGQKYSYRVRAKNTAGQVSGLSETSIVYHHIPAKMVQVSSLPNRKVECRFSEKVPTALPDLSRFFLKDSTGLRHLPQTATANGEYSYLFSFSENTAFGKYSFQCAGFKDLYGSPVASDSATIVFSPGIVKKEFFIESFQILDKYTIDLNFNHPPDSVQASNLQNYDFQPFNRVGSVSFSASEPKRITLRIENGAPVGSVGREFVLHVKNLSSNTATGSIPINEGAGSYLVLSGYSAGLSDVYAYPNPVRTAGTDRAITFAGLPRYAEISVYSMSGKLLKILKEKDGNGGVQWDLRDENNEEISSGIYFYLVRQLDQNNNEVESKMLKFGVVR